MLRYIFVITFAFLPLLAHAGVTEREAIRIAKREVKSKGLKGRRVDGALFHKGKWLVLFVKDYSSYSGDLLVSVSEDGKKVKVMGGK